MLGYAPNAAAQSMRTKVSRTIGFMVPDLTNYPNAAVAKAAEATLADAGYYMLLTDSDHDPRREERFLRLLRARQVDGIILYLSERGRSRGPGDDPGSGRAGGGARPQAAVRRRHGVQRAPGGDAARRSGISPRRAARRLALLSLNLRIRPRRERARGFRAAVRAAGLEPDEQRVVLADVTALHEAVERVLDATPRPDALLIDGSRLLAVGLRGPASPPSGGAAPGRGDRDRCGRAAGRRDAGGDRHRARFRRDRQARGAADDRSPDRRADRSAGDHRAAEPAGAGGGRGARMRRRCRWWRRHKC